ncbi:hypothetical protein AL073_01280 [Loktanella sp. 1ANDIMAR09]|nr:hypothetical protein AL073_01280 [Loktanella sp. 1ANDIMAR09]
MFSIDNTLTEIINGGPDAINPNSGEFFDYKPITALTPGSAGHGRALAQQNAWMATVAQAGATITPMSVAEMESLVPAGTYGGRILGTNGITYNKYVYPSPTTAGLMHYERIDYGRTDAYALRLMEGMTEVMNSTIQMFLPPVFGHTTRFP